MCSCGIYIVGIEEIDSLANRIIIILLLAKTPSKEIRNTAGSIVHPHK